jgi:hypothetical protein
VVNGKEEFELYFLFPTRHLSLSTADSYRTVKEPPSLESRTNSSRGQGHVVKCHTEKDPVPDPSAQGIVLVPES